MQKSFKQQCHQLMAELLARRDGSPILDLSKNKKFFCDLQTDGNKWDALQYLDAKGYISIAQNAVSGKLLQIHINKSGITYPADTAERVREKRIEWIRYIITTAIAVAAFIKSFFF